MHFYSKTYFLRIFIVKKNPIYSYRKIIGKFLFYFILFFLVKIISVYF